MSVHEHDDDHDVEGPAWLPPRQRRAYVPQPCRISGCAGMTGHRGFTLCPPCLRTDNLMGSPIPSIDWRPRLLVDAELLGLAHVLDAQAERIQAER